MEKFHFVAVDPRGKKFSGAIQANNKEDAHNKLQDRGLAMLSLEPYDEAMARKGKEGFLKFEFEGKDIKEKPVKGFIEATDDYAAYKKLRQEYDFQISFLAPADISPDKKEMLRMQGINPDLLQKYKEETKKVDVQESEKKQQQTQNEIESAAAEEKEQVRFLQEKIESILVQTKQLLENNAQYLDPQKKREIQERIDLLARLRQSNAIEHLKNITEKLLVQLSDDSLFIQSAEASAEEISNIAARRGEFKKAAGAFGKEMKAQLMSMEFQLPGVSSAELKKTLKELDPAGRFGMTIYWSIVSLFGLMTTFWLVNAARLLRSQNFSEIAFYYRSPGLWFVTGISALLSLSLAPQLFSLEPLSWKKRWTILGIALGLSLVFIIEFPAFFAWTR